MKRKLFCLLTLLLTVCSGAWAEVTSPYTLSWLNKASIPAKNATSVTSGDVTWGMSVTSSSDTWQANDRGIKAQVTKITFNTDEIPGKITKITINIGRNSNSYLSSLSMTCKVNNVVYGTAGTHLSAKANTDYEFTPLTAQQGTIDISIDNDQESDQLYIGSIKVEFQDAAAPTITAVDAASIKATTSGVNATTNIDVEGANLAGSTLTATLSPAVEGLSVNLASTTITAGAITTTATLTYNRTSNVKQGTTTLTISDGTTSKEIAVTYSATITPWTLQSISESTTWTFDDSNITSGTKSGGPASLTLYANIEGMTFGNDFDATALEMAGNYPYYSPTRIAQAKSMKFNTTVRGKVVVSYASPNSATAYISINGGNNGSTISATTTGSVAVNAGDVTIKGYSDEEHNTESLLNISQVVFTATPYSVTYNGNGSDGGVVPTDANYYASGESVTVLDNTGSLTKEEKIFGGWNTASDGSGISYVAGATFSISNDITLYAQWIEPAIVTMPEGTRSGYSCTGETATPGSDRTLYGRTVYQIAAGSSITLTIPATTVVSKITITGTSAESAGSNVTITGVTGDTSGEQSFNGRKGAIVSFDFVPKTQTTTYTISSGAAKPSWVIITIYGTEHDDITITPANNMSTYVTPTALDFTGIGGLTAYVATGKGTGTVLMSPVTAVPANTPLLLVGTAGTPYSVPVAAEASAPGTNYLKKGPETFTGTEENKYILWTDGKFHLVAAGTLAANKAYLDLAGTSARELSIAFEDDGETTAISEVRGLKSEVRGEYFNLNGQRVAQPTKGLYIVNGRKVVIK